jgi:hypothetical protein
MERTCQVNWLPGSIVVAPDQLRIADEDLDTSGTRIGRHGVARVRLAFASR